MNKELEKFLLNGRELHWTTISISSAAAWIWAVALLVSAQVTAQYGWTGLLWFTVPNALALGIFGFIAAPIRKRFPQGFTLVSYMQRYGKGVRGIYLLLLLLIQVCAIAVQLSGASSIIASLLPLPYLVVLVGLGGIFIAIIWIKGFLPVLKINLLQIAVLLGALFLIIPTIWIKASSVLDLKSLWQYTPGAALGFGIQGAIALLAGPPADQQHWQRAFALKNPRHIRRAFILAGLLFAVVPLLQGSLGLIARPLGIEGQMTGMRIIESFFPIGLIFLAAIFIVTLLSGISNALSAISTIGGTEMGDSIRSARLIILPLLIIGILLAWLQIPIIALWLFYGSLRSALVATTLIAALSPEQKMTECRIFFAVLLGLGFGIPIYLIVSPLIGTILLVGIPALSLLWRQSCIQY